jgi:hypothetical protein
MIGGQQRRQGPASHSSLAEAKVAGWATLPFLVRRALLRCTANAAKRGEKKERQLLAAQILLVFWGVWASLRSYVCSSSKCGGSSGEAISRW